MKHKYPRNMSGTSTSTRIGGHVPAPALFLAVVLQFCFTAPLAAQGDAASGRKHFMQLANSRGKTCVECHYLTEPDTISWNPSAAELGRRAGIYSVEGIGRYFTSPEGKLMQESHEGISLDGTLEEDLVAWLAELEGSPPPAPGQIRWRLILFLGMFLLLILLGVERRRLGRIPKAVRRGLKPLAWAVILVIMFQDAVGFNRSKNYEPVQPVKFSHSVHAADNRIDCNYCHSGVLRGRNAGIPPVSLCMNCHKHQPEGTRSGFFEIRKIREAAEDSIPIRWIRVHNLPDFSYFNHMQHVTVGGVECAACHGDVENMHVIRQVEDLSMGWCIDCHDRTKLDFSNEYYKLYYPEMLDSLQTGKIDSIMVSDIMGRECSVCHH